MPSTPRERATGLLVLGCALTLAYLAVRPHLYVSWTPSDDGVLAQGADRVLRGELPHRDFVALWSGGLDYLNAAAFRVLGERLTTLRTVVAAAWLAGLAAMFAVARRILPAWPAGLLTVCAALWTLPLSPHPLPSWYTLALGLCGAAAVVEWTHSRRRRWLAVAGVAAGASIAVKIVGLYFVAAVFLFFVWQVQDDLPATSKGSSRTRAYAWTITAGLVGFLGLVGALWWNERAVNSAVHFVVPACLLVGVLLWREWRLPALAGGARFAALFGLVLPFVLGAALATAPWLWPYVRAHALGDLARGLFVTPRLRLIAATYPLPGLRSAAVSAAPFIVLLAGAPFVRRPLRRIDRIALVLVVAGALAFSFAGSPVVLVTWYGLRLMTPVCAALAAWWLVAPPPGMEIPKERAALVFFLTAAAVTGSLIQIPFALYTYFLYFIPLLALALAALLTAGPAMPREVPAALLAFVLLFGWRNPASLAPPPANEARDALAPLALARGGIIVSRDDSTLYAQLMAAIRQHADGEWLYVWHDAPQLYFLAGMRNPTRTLFEAFDDAEERSPGSLTATLQRHDVRLVVLTDSAGAYRPMDPAFRAWLVTEYPESAWVRRFELRWRRGPFRLKG